MIKKIILTTAILVGCSVALFAQGGTLPFLRLNADARTGGMGDATMGEATGMYIYTNPTSFLMDSTKNIYGSYTFGMLPKIGDDRLMYHAASAGYKLGRQAILVGFRYYGGLEVNKVSLGGLPSKKTVKPYDYAVDLTYTRDLGHNFSAYLTGTFVQSYVGKTSNSGSASGGVYWRNATNMSGTPLTYTIGLGFYDFGSVVKYDKTEYDQPASVGLGGSFGFELSKEHQLNLGWTARYFVLPTDATDFTGGFGAEYVFKNRVAARTGYHFEDLNRHATLGLGFRMEYFQLDLAYKISAEKDIDDALYLGCSVRF